MPARCAALPILRTAAHGYVDGWSLTRLGWLYAILAAAVAGIAARAASVGGLRQALILAPPVAPLAEPDFARFFLSTFSEPQRSITVNSGHLCHQPSAGRGD